MLTSLFRNPKYKIGDSVSYSEIPGVAFTIVDVITEPTFNRSQASLVEYAIHGTVNGKRYILQVDERELAAAA